MRLNVMWKSDGRRARTALSRRVVHSYSVVSMELRVFALLFDLDTVHYDFLLSYLTKAPAGRFRTINCFNVIQYTDGKAMKHALAPINYTSARILSWRLVLEIASRKSRFITSIDG